MSIKVQSGYFKLIFILKIIAFIVWVTLFTLNSFEVFRLLFCFQRLAFSYSLLALISMLAEIIIIYLFVYVISLKKICTKLAGKISFYLLTMIISSQIAFNLPVYSYLEFFGLTLTTILLLNIARVFWSRLPIFKLKIFYVAS